MLVDRDEVAVNGGDDNEVEFSLSDLVDFLYKSRWLIFWFGLIGLTGGILLATSKPNEYNSQITVIPEVPNKGGSNLGNLGSLAGLAGINLDNLAGSTEAIRPDLYQNVIQSVPFALAILKTPVYSKEFKRTQPLDAYLTQTNKGVIGQWLPIGASDGQEVNEEFLDPTNKSGALQVTKQQDERIKEILGRVNAQYDKKSGIIMVSATMPDPVVAATIANKSLDYLTNYATTYRTEKARQQVDFLNRQVAASKRRYQYAEEALSAYRDRNRGLFLNSAKIEEQRMQAEFLLAQDLYNNLTKQLEMAKIKVQEETPVFKVLEPAQIPLKKVGPQRTLIVLGCLLFSIALSIAFSFVKLKVSTLTKHYPRKAKSSGQSFA